jgi:undecaprenyl-diphosphatase
VLDVLLNIDRQIFLAIHQDMANSFFDILLPILREAKTWIPLYLIFAFLAVYKFKLKGLYILAAAGIIVLLADQFSSGFMKPYFERLRPCHEPSLMGQIRNLIDCGGAYGFISSHAANHFGLAIIFTWFFKEITRLKLMNWIFYVWAGLISFAQVYVAKHYPSDVVVGALSGILIGWLIVTFLKKFVLTKESLKIN